MYFYWVVNWSINLLINHLIKWLKFWLINQFVNTSYMHDRWTGGNWRNQMLGKLVELEPWLCEAMNLSKIGSVYSVSLSNVQYFWLNLFLIAFGTSWDFLFYQVFQHTFYLYKTKRTYQLFIEIVLKSLIGNFLHNSFSLSWFIVQINTLNV